MKYLQNIAVAAMKRPILVFAMKLSLVVGTVLNLINQGGVLLGEGVFSWLHCGLNYLVPFLVSAFSGGRNELRRQQAQGRQGTV